MIDLITYTPTTDNVLPGANRYNNIHNIFLLCSYILFNILFVGNFMYEMVMNNKKD
jgi:hypothetical protein